MKLEQEPKYNAVVLGADNETRLVNRHSGRTIPDDEPIFIFRARDLSLIDVLENYIALCEIHDAPEDHLQAIAYRRDQIAEWQKNNPDRIKVPDTELKGWFNRKKASAKG